MREKTSISKQREGRGVITDESYTAWRTANEAKSTGTSAMLWDPVSGRSVSCLSNGEKKVFWMLRFHDNVEEIYDQFPLEKDGENGTDAICRKLGIHINGYILSTDFLVKKKDGTYAAVSVKASGKVFSEGSRKYASLVRRQAVEKLYWEKRGVPFRIIFADSVSDVLAANVRNVMRYYPREMAVGREGKLKHLIARKAIRIDNIDREHIPFAVLASELDVERIFYETYKK